MGEARVEALLVEAPGAWLFRAREPSGRRALVQVAPLADASDEDPPFAERLRFIEAVTEQVGSDLEVEIEDHGFLPSGQGGGALYWRAPWTGAAERIGQTRLESAQGLLTAASSLFERLVARHARGRVDPLLHAALVVPRTGGADLVGIPVSAPATWLAPGFPAPPLAPEERATGEARSLGDVWRLGEALRVFSGGITDRPDGFEAWLDQLTDPDPNHRVSSAREALQTLRSFRDEGRTATFSVPQSDALRQVKGPRETLVDEDGLLPVPRERHVAEEAPPNPGPASELPKPRATGPDEAPTMWMHREQLTQARKEAAANLQPTGPKGTVVGVRLAGEGEAARGDGRRAPPTRVFDDPASGPSARAGVGGGDVGSADPSGSPGLPRGPGGTVAAQPLPTPASLRGAQLGYGPQGTVAAEPIPAGIAARAPRPEALGYGPGGTVAGDLRAIPRSGSGIGAPLVGFERSAPVHPPPSSASEPARAAPPPPKSAGPLAFTVIALALLAVAAAVVVQLLKPVVEEAPTASPLPTETASNGNSGRRIELTPWNDVLLETVPADAHVIGERDGSDLGASPVRLLVPEGQEVAVLVTAEGYEPVRLVLPSRGRVTVHLTSTEGVIDCPVELSAPGPLEVVGMGLTGENGRYKIPGAVAPLPAEGRTTHQPCSVPIRRAHHHRSRNFVAAVLPGEPHAHHFEGTGRR
ncbi:MAG: hypothetical protein AAFZ18_17455, partial [Myxococcota bacterium]